MTTGGRAKIGVTILAAAAALAGVAWRLAVSAPALPQSVLEAVRAPGDAAAGRIVFFAGGCASCHMSPGQDDPTLLGGGRELKTPFGSFYPPNISPSAANGLGRWSAGDFAGALLTGRAPDGHPYYPAFPYTSYARLTPEDVRDLFAFLRTTKPVETAAPPHALSFPFNVRASLRAWQALFFAPGPLPEVAAHDDAWRRGRYLVEGPGHCAECHSPRNLLGAIEPAKRLHGGPSPDGKGKTPDITAAGLKDWTSADVEEALNSGFTPTGDSLGGAMAEVVRNTARLPAGDRAAMAVYLKSVR